MGEAVISELAIDSSDSRRVRKACEAGDQLVDLLLRRDAAVGWAGELRMMSRARASSAPALLGRKGEAIFLPHGDRNPARR